MRRKILVINGNPDPAPERLGAALADAYCDGAKAGGYETQRINVGALDFPLLHCAHDFTTAPDTESIRQACHGMLAADHVVFVYPLWLGGPPALLKGFMEQIARGGVALGKGAHGLPTGRLKGRSARVIVTMGMPAPVYRLWYGAHGVRGFNHSILGISGIRPITTTYIGMVGTSLPRCRLWIDRVRQLGRHAA